MELEINSEAQVVKDRADEYIHGGGAIMVTPLCIADDRFWYFRVKVSRKQAVIGFPKFGTIGIGFEKEEDWNTNLPYTSDAIKIYEHIRHNRLGANRQKCIEAIRLIQEAAKKFKQ